MCERQKVFIEHNLRRGDDPGAPYVNLTKCGHIVDENIIIMNGIYENLKVTDYMIMPNHIHLIIRINNNGRSRSLAPTWRNSTIPQYISALKRFCNKEYEVNIWQRSYYDHIIRSEAEADYIEKLNYIMTNPAKWADDEYY